MSEPAPPPWRAAAESARARLQRWRQRGDGTLLARASGPHFIVLTKGGSELRLWLMEQGRSRTGVVQSEIDLDAPLRLIEGYTQALSLALLWRPAAERVYFSGLGGGRVPLVFQCLLPEARLDIAEIDPNIIEIAQQFFGLAPDDRTAIRLVDGRRGLEESAGPYDAIIVDVFLDNGYTPYRQATYEFFRLCRSRMTPEGVLTVNLLESDPYTARKIAGLRAVFAYVYYVRIEDENTVLFASDYPAITPPTARSRAHRLDAAWQLPYPFVALAATLTNDWSYFCDDMDGVEPLYDDDPPHDYFVGLPLLSAAGGAAPGTWPCPCGSGRDYAGCHGVHVGPPPVPG